MKEFHIIFPLLLIFSVLGFSVEYDQYFTDNTLRIDFFHSGTKDEEKISIDHLYQISPWAGPSTNLIDTLNSGYYMIRVFDAKSNRLIYSYGFSTLFNEWQTTEEAIQGGWKTIHETALIPFPKNEIQVEFLRRDKKGYFTEHIFNTRVNPQSYDIIKEDRASHVRILDSVQNGHYSEKVDLAIIAEGFTSNELTRFQNAAHDFVDTMFTISPFKEYRDAFNIYYIARPSSDAGTDEPRKDIFRKTPLNTSFNTFNSQRYMMTFDTKSVHDIASIAPYDAIIILVNSETYGGGGIYNFYASTSAFNEWSAYVFVHEFGHSFAGLGDEYYTSDVAYSEFYSPGTEPWEVNVSALLDLNNVKWDKYIDQGIPIPTPWDKEKFDNKNSEYRKGLEHPYRGKVGAFEGAGYAFKGLYRPSLNCIMFSKGLPGFDPVCQNAIERRIEFLIK